MSEAGQGAPRPDPTEARPAGAAPPPPPQDPPPQPSKPAGREIGGPSGPEPTRYGDWERKGRVSDF